MAERPPPNAPQSIVLNVFDGIRNDVSRERLTAKDLERGLNIDIDELGQPRRRRGYTLALSGNWHSIKTITGKTFGVKDGVLGIIRPAPAFFSLGVTIGPDPCAYTDVDEEVYFSSEGMSGVITVNETVQPWGHTDGQGVWFSPVYTPTDTLGAVGGSLLGDPPIARHLGSYKGRIYLAVDKVLWTTELFRYHYVDRTTNFMQFEEPITMVAPMTDGLFIGTEGGVYFLLGIFGKFKVNQLSSAGVMPGSLVQMPAALVHPQIRKTPVPESQASVFMTDQGVMAGFDGGECYNLTQGYGEEWHRFTFPEAQSAAALHRLDLGDSTYVAVLDSQGTPSANARIGDFIDAEIIRAVDRVGG